MRKRLLALLLLCLFLPCACAEEFVPLPAEKVSVPAYSMNEAENTLWQVLAEIGTLQEGWQVQFIGEDTLVMLAAPHLLVWQLPTDGNVLRLRWWRDLYDFLPEGSGNPVFSVSPNGERVAIASADSDIFLADASGVASLGATRDIIRHIVWAQDSQSFALVGEDYTDVYTQDGLFLRLMSEPVLPMNDMLSWMNPPAVPEKLQALLDDQTLDFAGACENCVLFDAEDSSCAYLPLSDTVVKFDEMIFSTMTISRSGICPVYDEESECYRLAMPDGTFTDTDVLDRVTRGDMANPCGWLGDTLCVLDQDFTNKSEFRLCCAFLATGLTRTFLTPWDAQFAYEAACAAQAESESAPE